MYSVVGVECSIDVCRTSWFIEFFKSISMLSLYLVVLFILKVGD